jgi:single-strand selective monofunctional uracil DNA glycosylase
MYSHGQKRAVFLGMNPGPWGMAQTGIPFGEVNAVRNFLRINSISLEHPDNEHIKYPVKGLDCAKSEVSGKRLWGLFSQRFGTAENFFQDHFVLNYCPLLFIARNEKGGFRNYTPDRIRQDESALLFELCDMCLIKAIEILNPQNVVGIGNFAYNRAKKALVGMNVNVSKILHPSPASPSANKNWAEKAASQLIESGVWQ